jgi:sugar phosphate isomerase/epimerase
MHLPLGHGNVDWVKTIKGLNNIGFSGTLIIESYNGISESLSLLKRLVN